MIFKKILGCFQSNRDPDTYSLSNWAESVLNALVFFPRLIWKMHWSVPILTFFGDTAFLVHNIADIYFKLEVRVKMIDCLDLIPLMLVLLLFLQHSGKSLVSLSLSVDIPLLSTFNRTWKQRFDDEEQGGKKRRKNRLIQP